MSNKLMTFGINRKKVELRCSLVKSHVLKESGFTIYGRREVEVGILSLSNDKSNVIAENLLSCF